MSSAKDAEDEDNQSVNIGSQQFKEEILMVNGSKDILETAIRKEPAVSTEDAMNDKDEPSRTTQPASDTSLDLTTSRDDSWHVPHKSNDAGTDYDADSHQAKNLMTEVQTGSGNNEDKDG